MSNFTRIALVLSLVACSSSPTQVIVEIDADEAVRELTQSLSIDIAARGLGDDGFQTVQLVSTLANSWPRQHVLAPANGDVTRTYRLNVSALDTSGQAVVRARVISGYIADETRVLRVYLEAACLRRSCEVDSANNVDETCSGGTCVDTPFIDPSLLPAPGSPVADAGVDAMDASTDVVTPPTCEGAGEECALESAPCVLAHLVCDGDIAVCTPDEGSTFVAGRECGDAEGVCALASMCSAEGACVPQTQADGTSCGDGDEVCIDGGCAACDGPCSLGESCEVGRLDCTGDAPMCVGTGEARDDGDTCRLPIGLCDAAEVCDGASLACPEDSVLPSGTECRAKRPGLCDAVDTCDGVSSECSNALVPMGTQCRPSRDEGLCDTSESCTGTSETCPEDVYAEAASLCRAPTGPCDPAEFCQPSDGAGSPTECESDTEVRTGMCTVPDSTTEGTCTAGGTCLPPDEACNQPCPSPSNPCEFGIFDCSTGSPICVDAPEPMPRDEGTSCGAAEVGNDCDRPNTCDGAGSCVERREVDGTTCGDSPSGCFAQSVCDDGECVVQFQPSTQTCRAATECTLEQTCDGAGSCPVAENASSSTPCGGDVGACSARTCTGTGVCGAATPINNGGACMPTSSVCNVGVCTVGSCESTPTPGAPCGGGVCNSGGSCTATLVISEVSFRSGVSGSIVELYNASIDAASVNGCRLRYQNPGGGFSNINLSGVVPGHGFYSIGQGSPDTSALVNINSAASVRLLCSTRIIDTVGWGNNGDTEGPRLPTAVFGQSFERKACSGSVLADMESGGDDADRGNSRDTNNNAADFVIRTRAEIQNTSSAIEVPLCI
ncbi:MAG: hypothetical protein AB8H86_20250 [Polyangiales bacterium]